MMVASQRELSDEGKHRLAVQLLDSPSVDAAVKHLSDWDSAFALQTLLELHARSGNYAPRRAPSLKLYVVYALIIAFMGMIALGFEFWLPCLVIGSISFAGQCTAHHRINNESIALRTRIQEILVCLLPETTPTDLPIVLEIAVRLGSPEATPTLREALSRLLPFFDSTTAQSLTDRQHEYLLSLLHTPHEELLIVVLLALGTLGNPRDAEHIRDRVRRGSPRIREARRECLTLLDGADPS